MRRLFLLPQAAADLDDLYDPLYSRVLFKIETLREFPFLGPVLDGRLAEHRSLTIGIVRIIYRVTPSAVVIAYVRHSRRRLPRR